jgi:hypothetical protein
MACGGLGSETSSRNSLDLTSEIGENVSVVGSITPRALIFRIALASGGIWFSSESKH